MEIEIELQVECEGTYRKGSPDYFDSSFGNWLPGDPEEVDNFKVFLRCPTPKKHHLQEPQLEITQFLSESEYEELYNAYLEQCREAE